MRKLVEKTLAVAALAGAAVAASSGAAVAKPLPSGPGALGALTGLSALDRDGGNGSNVDTGSPLVKAQETNLLNLMSDHSRHQNTGTSGNQG